MYRKFERYDVYPKGTWSAETCVPRQHSGERMDYDHALMVMMQR